MDSIYTFIKSYIPNSTRDPKEDFLTQILAWTLINVPDFKEQYTRFLINHLENPKFSDLLVDSTLVETQYANENGYIDMLIHEGNYGFIIEHKIDSSLSIDQIDKYRNAISKQFNGYFYTVLITTTHIQHTQKADIKLIWADVYDFILSVIDDYENQDHFLLNQLSEYLKQQGLGRMNPVDMDNILGYFPGMQLESKLDIMFERLTTLDWRLHCQYLNTFQNDKYLPSFNKKRWGRKGIDFYTSWKPGIFAGVIMDGSDHGLKPADESNGPDFVVILEYDYAKKDPTIMERRNYFLSSTNFRELSDRLNSNSGSFEYLSKLDKSPWRVIVLRQSLKDILTGTNTMQEQIGAMRNSIIEGINLLTQDDLLGR